MATATGSHIGAFIKVWIGLLVLTLIEVILGYIQFNTHIMLTLLMGFSIVKAYLIMAYFMHLKYDRPSLSWLLVPPLIACILIMVGYFFPDSFRILVWRS
jgi:cytochrome c oxidase subunit 4